MTRKVDLMQIPAIELFGVEEIVERLDKKANAMKEGLMKSEIWHMTEEEAIEAVRHHFEKWSVDE